MFIPIRTLLQFQFDNITDILTFVRNIAVRFNMQRKFIFNLLLLVFINLLVKPLAIFGIDAEVQNQVGYADYGMYFSVFNFTYLFNILLDLGITNFNIRNVAQYPILSKRYIGKLISLRLLLFVLYGVVTLAIGIIAGYEGKQFTILIWMIFNQFLLSFLLFFRSYFSGMLLFALDAFFSVFDRLILIGICGYFLYWKTDSQFDIYYFIFAQTFAYLISIFLATFIIVKKIGLSSFRVRKTFSLAIFKKAFPYAILILTMSIYTRSDAVLLERIHPNGDVQAGLYAQAYRILDAVVMFSMLFNTLLFPIFSNILGSKKDFRPLLLTASKLIFTLSISVIIGCFFYANAILHLFYDDLQSQSTLIFQLLIFAFLPISAIQIFGTLHTAAGNLRFLNSVASIGIAVSVGINLFLIPKYGAVGTAITCIVTHFVIATIQISYTKSLFRLPMNWAVLLKFCIFSITLIATAFFLSTTYHSFGESFGIFLIVSVLLAILLRLIDIKALVNILKTKEEY